jgi:zinc transport system substrate-binding protein
MAVIGRALQMRLARLDPENEEAYRANAVSLEAELDSLDRSFRMGLANCERRDIVTSHEAFGYLARSYGLEEVGVSGLDPETEPSPGRLAELVQFVKDNSVKTIFFEVLVSPEVAETLARETGAETAKLDPLEGPPERGDYFDTMRANLDALRAGLGCR